MKTSDRKSIERQLKILAHTLPSNFIAEMPVTLQKAAAGLRRLGCEVCRSGDSGEIPQNVFLDLGSLLLWPILGEFDGVADPGLIVPNVVVYREWEIVTDISVWVVWLGLDVLSGTSIRGCAAGSSTITNGCTEYRLA